MIIKKKAKPPALHPDARRHQDIMDRLRPFLRYEVEMRFRVVNDREEVEFRIAAPSGNGVKSGSLVAQVHDGEDGKPIAKFDAW